MEQTFLIVGYRHARYAIDAQAVRELVWLPELAPVEEFPPFIRGLFNLRGQIIPVLDLGSRFGHGRSTLSVQDRVVVIEEGPHRLGLLVQEVFDVMLVQSQRIEPVSNFQLPGGETKFLRGEVKLDDGLLMLLDLSALLRESPDLDTLTLEAGVGSDAPAENDDTELFRARALRLAQTPAQQDTTRQVSYALIRLDREWFGLDVSVVSKFVHLRGLTPIPCSPSHVAGNMNLRGDILTVIDIRPVLGLSPAPDAPEVAVVKIGELQFGILVEAIDDVVSFSDTRIVHTTQADDGPRACFGVVTLDHRVTSLIDTDRLLAALLARRPLASPVPTHQP